MAQNQTTALSVLTGDVKSALSKMKVNEKIAFLQKVSEYVGADTEDTNKYLNTPVKIKGVLIHTATINKDTKQTLNEVTGEITEEPVYIEAERTVFKLENGKVLGFVSISIASYVKDYLIPAFGFGDWHDEEGKELLIPIKFTQVASKGGRAYSIQVLSE